MTASLSRFSPFNFKRSNIKAPTIHKLARKTQVHPAPMDATIGFAAIVSTQANTMRTKFAAAVIEAPCPGRASTR